MVRRSQKTKNRMLDERLWMQQRCAEIERREQGLKVNVPDVNKADNRGMTPLHAAGMW